MGSLAYPLLMLISIWVLCRLLTVVSSGTSSSGFLLLGVLSARGGRGSSGAVASVCNAEAPS